VTDEVRRRWEETARWFQADLDLPVAVNWDGLGELTEADLGLLGDVAGADVVELGCGGGQCAVALAERGADVVGVDLSREQLRFARSLATERGVADPVAHHQADVTHLRARPDGRFDVAFNTYVFQWVPDPAAAVAEAFRLLRPGGRFAFAVPHPYYDVVDPDSGRVTGSYFDTGRQVTPDPETETDLVTYRHRVADVVTAVVEAGFALDAVLEPGTSDPSAYDRGPWGERVPSLMARVPATLVVAADKPA
jgi:SAM-dependent methyltransferase